MVQLFTDVALSDPLSAVLVALGAAVVGAPSLAFGYLVARGLGTLVTAPPGRGPPRQAE